MLVFPHPSVADQVRVASNVLPQCPLTFVTVARIEIVEVPLLSVAVGASKLQAVPCSTVLLVLLQVMTGAVVSTTLTVCAHCEVLPQLSEVAQVRVASKVAPQWPAVLVVVEIMVIA